MRPTGRPVSADELRETMRQQMITSIGGWSGAVIAAIPTTVFIVVNIATSVRPAIWSAVGSAVLLTVYRLARRQSIQQALSGLVGVAIAAFFVARTGQARGYYLFGILTSFAYAVPFAISVVVRRPLVGLFWEFLDPTSLAPGDTTRWYRRRPLLVAYQWATLTGMLVFLLRGVVQLILYKHNADGWLGVARIAMGYPLFILAVGVAFVVVRRARTLVSPPPDAESSDHPVVEG